jgi:hypothetical protein
MEDWRYCCSAAEVGRYGVMEMWTDRGADCRAAADRGVEAGLRTCDLVG